MAVHTLLLHKALGAFGERRTDLGGLQRHALLGSFCRGQATGQSLAQGRENGRAKSRRGREHHCGHREAD
eukprot:scaffold34_cov260-Pinguiococcus_pyrenoidosus.AAC.11